MGIFSCLAIFGSSNRDVEREEEGTVKGSESFGSDRTSEKMSDRECRRMGEEGGGEPNDGRRSNPKNEARRSILRTWASVDQLGYNTIPSPSTIGEVLEIRDNHDQEMETSRDSKATTRPSTAPRLREKPSTPVSGSVKTKVSFSGREGGRDDRSRKSSMHQTPPTKVVGIPTQFQAVDHGQHLSSRVYTSENVKQGKRNSKR